MKCNVHIYLLNEHFSQEHADAQHGGEESENNQRYEWEDELTITSDVSEIKELRKATFPLQGELANGEPFLFEVENMFLVEILSTGYPSIYMGCSESILDHHTIEKLGDETQVNIYIKDYEPMANPVPGIFIASKEFPKELITE